MLKRRQKIRKGFILVSFFLFPAVFYYLSPVLVVQASADGIVNGSLVVFLLMFLSALFLGRAYCGWICPAAGCQEALFSARDKRITKGDYLKWLIWTPWVISILFLAAGAGGYYHIDFFYRTTYGLSISDLQSFITYNIVLFVLIVLPAFIVGKRSFCHHLCWMAPFMILGRKIRNGFHWAALQLGSYPERCVHCHTCTQNCPMSLEVETMVNRNAMEHTECILCGSCVDSCPQNAICYNRGKPNRDPA